MKRLQTLILVFLGCAAIPALASVGNSNVDKGIREPVIPNPYRFVIEGQVLPASPVDPKLPSPSPITPDSRAVASPASSVSTFDTTILKSP
jgi:hypothetical protein